MAGVEKIKRQLKAWLKQNIRQLSKGLSKGLASALVALMLFGCANRARPVQLLALPDIPSGQEVRRLNGSISEVASPAIFADLDALIADSQPQVAIAYPKPNQVLNTTTFTASIKLRALSIYKDETLNLGPHLQVSLDDQPARSIYSLDEPIEFTDLSPGTHTLRAIAVKPWGESFKNEAAYAQTTFHIFADTGAGVPNLEQPQLVYVQPQGTYGAQPILLDFYLLNAPLHDLAQIDPTLTDWEIRCIINGESFVFDQWRPIYLKGFQPGQNWVKVTLIDEQGNPIENAFNSTVRLINYDPEQRDTLARLTRSEFSIEAVGQIADPNYEPPAEVPEEALKSEQPAEEIPEPNSKPSDSDTSTTTSEQTTNDAVKKADNVPPEDTAAEAEITPPILLNEDPITTPEIEAATPSKIILDQKSDLPTLIPSEDELVIEQPNKKEPNSFDTFAADRPAKKSVETNSVEADEPNAEETQAVEVEPLEVEPLEVEPVESPSMSVEQSLENILEDTSEDLSKDLEGLRESTEDKIEETFDEFQESTEDFLKNTTEEFKASVEDLKAAIEQRSPTAPIRATPAQSKPPNSQTPSFFERLQMQWQQFSAPASSESLSTDPKATDPKVTVEAPVTTNPLDKLTLPSLSDKLQLTPETITPDAAD